MTSGDAIRLEWPGKTTPRPPPDAELTPVRAGDPSARLVHGDNLAALGALHGQGERYALVYLDPPFFTGRKHEAVSRTRSASGEIVRNLRPAFDDRWSSFSEYLSALRDRIAAARELLHADGCLVVHVDPKTSHYVKVVCDEIFGPRAFASEIVWHYRRWPARTRNFQRMHDVLLRYVRDPDVSPRFCQLYEPLAPSTLATWGDRKQRAVVDASGRRRRSSSTAQPTPGTPLGDVWQIGIVAPVARERTGYPTQKPEALLRRLVEACTAAGDAVLDLYAGSGTTLAVCHQLGRRSVGLDASADALEIARQRLLAMGLEATEERVLLRSARPGVHTARKRARASKAAAGGASSSAAHELNPERPAPVAEPRVVA